MIGLLDHLPEEGEEVDYGNLHLKVEEMDKTGSERSVCRSTIRRETEDENRKNRGARIKQRKKRMQQTGSDT
ncbi:MAG: hypothetical protein ACLUD2_02755 [Clostridium sp.]